MVDRVQALRYFQAHNHERIHRLIELAPPRHAIFYQLLPLLFHINSKVLPAYVDNDTPAGIIDYRPDKDIIDKAKQFEKSFSYRRRALRRYPLRGLYLLNESGQLSYPDAPSFSLWLLHGDNLSVAQRQLLQQKVRAVCDWAAELNIELHSRLLSESDLKQQMLSAWELDQFYSTGVVLAGSIPYWWLLSPEEDLSYQHSLTVLQSQRMLNQVSLIDFGEVGEFDAESLFNAASQKAHDAMQQGSQAQLDLLYLQHYLQSATKPSPLSSLFKQQLYQDNSHVLQQDINRLKLTVIEAAAEQDNVDNARQALYLLSREKLSQNVRQPAHPWRRDFIRQQVKQWLWTDEQIKALDALQGDINAIARQFAANGKICRHFIDVLKDFSQQHQLNTRDELNKLLTLHSLRFQPAADVITALPLALRPQSNSERLYLYRFSYNKEWLLSQRPLQNGTQAALYKHENLLHLLSWAIVNQVLCRSNWLSVIDQHQRITTSTVVELSQQLLRSPLAISDLSTEKLSSPTPPQATQIMLFANLEQQPQDKMAQQGLQLSSKQNDPLNYTSFKHSLIAAVDGLICSDLGQWHSFSFQGETSPLEMLIALLRWQPGTNLQQPVQSWCPTAIFGQAISSRLSCLVAEACRHFSRFPQQGHILLNVADRPYTVQWQQQQSEFVKRKLDQDLWQALAANDREFNATYLDKYLDSDGLLNTLLSYQAADKISVFV
ncbi:class I adenylate cyclase, partial [Methylophaga sp. OBS4]|uniref:class I adenylate cyclase n=1 Tax=Methylophaga sp. OBS4 TaxID=2991935 RepID=UPI00225C098F